MYDYSLLFETRTSESLGLGDSREDSNALHVLLLTESAKRAVFLKGSGTDS